MRSRCVQCVIDEQLRKMDKSLEVMNALETAAISAEERLSVTRASTRARPACGRASVSSG